MKRYQPATRSDSYDAPDLFPEYGRQRSIKTRRQYITDVLVGLAKSRTLFVTDLLRQENINVNDVGQVIFGQHITPDSHELRTDAPVPRELADYRVTLRSLNGESIKWCDGMEAGEPIIKGKAGRFVDENTSMSINRVREVWVDTEETEAQVSLREAWIALKANGKNCRRAPSARQQAALWRYEEVRPVAPEMKRKSA